MDEPTFEKRLSRLNDAYKDIPVTSSHSKMMESIEGAGYKRNKKWLSIPLAAGFTAIALFTIILTVHVTGLNIFENAERQGYSNVPPAESDVVSVKEDLRDYYESRLKSFEEKLGNPYAKQYQFVVRTEESLQVFEKRDSFQSEKEMEKNYNQLKSQIDISLSTLREHLTMIKEQKEPDSHLVLSYLEKRDLLYEDIQSQWTSITLKKSLGNVSGNLVDRLNKGEDISDSQEVNSFAAEAISSGYKFVLIEGMVEVRPNPAVLSGAALNEETRNYIDYSGKSIVYDGILSVGRESLRKDLLELEGLILSHPHFSGTQKLKQLYHHWLSIYLKGTDNSPIYKNGKVESAVLEEFTALIKHNGNTYTSQAAKEFYEELQERNFELNSIEELREIEIVLPEDVAADSLHSANINLLPLSYDLRELYDEVHSSKEPTLLLKPSWSQATIDEKTLRLYFHAMVKGDFETAYTLLDDKSAPSWEEFAGSTSKEREDIIRLNSRFSRIVSDYSEAEVHAVKVYTQDGIEYLFQLREDERGISRLFYRGYSDNGK
ncbi:hypothetical protein GJU40_15730 [Bacillus lacus]|uniref:Uncharacterized protein n=1 Tax=Metabacillus lacus TaxID=1983721 RepID=A0A7X2LYH7_9BACI|nr:hypothetical protein [Metabacillus lacus]MRX73595.1 hypothetical protein [Metabacillus lacus]